MAGHDDKIIAAIRARSRRAVHQIFAALALGSIVIGLVLHHYAAHFAPGAADIQKLSATFLFLGAAETVTMFVWDWLFLDDV